MELKSKPLETRQLEAELLIVPYGIEINVISDGQGTSTPFNRTLWN